MQTTKALAYAVRSNLRTQLAVTLSAALAIDAEYAGALRTMQAVARGLRDAGLVDDASTFAADVLADVKELM